MADDYDDILNRSWDDIPIPQVLPLGSYLLRNRNVTYKPATDTASARVLFFYNVREPMDDVDADALAELGEDYDLSTNQVVASFFVESARDWDTVRNHLALHGVDLSGKTIREAFKEVRGKEVVAYLDQRT